MPKLKRFTIARLLVRWHWILLGLLLGIGIGFLQAWKATPKYQSTATVLIRDHRAAIMGQEDAVEFDLRNRQSLETIREGLTTFDLCHEVAADLSVRGLKGLVPLGEKTLLSIRSGEPPAEPEVPPATELARMIRSWLSVNLRKDTRLIDVKITHPQPVVARTIANQIVTHYMRKRKKMLSDAREETFRLLVADAQRVKAELQETEGMLAGYAASLEAEKRLAQMEVTLDTLSLRYRHKHPMMISAQAEFAQARERMAQFLEEMSQKNFDKGHWAPFLNQIGVSNNSSAIDQFRDLLISRRAVLESEIESQKTLFNTLNNQIGAGELTVKQSEAEVAPLEPAALPTRPFTPPKTSLILKNSGVGLIAGLGLAFLLQWGDNKFRTVAEIEDQLKLPVLSAFPRMEEKGLHEPEKGRAGRDLSRFCGREKWDQKIVFRNEAVNSHYAEMYRVLRTSISLLGPAPQRKTTMITSALRNEGKSLVSTNLALALAQQGSRTLLIDGDLRKPSIHKLFGLKKDARPGVVDLLTGNADLDHVLQPLSEQPNLTLLLNGTRAPNPGELLESALIQEFLTQFEDRFDHIVIDTAPLLAVPDSRILAPHVKNLCLVVSAETTPRKAVMRAIDILAQDRVSPDGLVFNRYLERRVFIGEDYNYGAYGYGASGYGAYGYGAYGSVYGDEEDS